MALRVVKYNSGIYAGLWVVEDHPSGIVLDTAKTNAAAWRKADKISNEAIRPQYASKDFTKCTNEYEDMQAWWSALLGLAYRKGRKRGWAAHVFKDKFGMWPPDHLSDEFGAMFPAVGLFLANRAGVK